MTKKLSPILTILILAIVTVSAVAAIFYFAQQVRIFNPQKDWKMYKNEKLGVQFIYEPRDESTGKNNIVKLEGNTIEICIEKWDFCHSITVFNIGNSTPENYLRENFMQGVSEKCRIQNEILGNWVGATYPSTYKTFFITSFTNGKTFGDLENCGEYGNRTGLGYFLFNSRVPNKLLWISAGMETMFSNPRKFFQSIKIF